MFPTRPSRDPFRAPRGRVRRDRLGRRRSLAPHLEQLERLQLLTGNVISGYVYQDLNGNGLRNAGDSPIPNSTLQLKNGSGDVVGTATTDADGYYRFDTDATIGTAPLTQSFSAPTPLSTTDWTDSVSLRQFDPALGTLLSVTLTFGGTLETSSKVENTSADPTILQVAGTGNLAFDGPGGSSYNVSLSNQTDAVSLAAFDGTIDFDGPSGHDFGAVSGSGSKSATVTDAAGLGLYTGTGTVSFAEAATASYGLTSSNSGDPANLIRTGASAFVTVSYTYVPDTSLKPGNYTIVQTPQPSGYQDGQESSNGVVLPNSAGGPDSIPVTLTNTNLPNNDFGELMPVTIGDFVWNDLNGNGQQDGGEPGIPGVTLTLTGTTGAGNPVTATTTTDAGGHYSFTEPPGTYTVSVATPAGYVPTVTNQGFLLTDSNPSPSGTTPSLLLSDHLDNSIDFGFYRPVRIGDIVWNDLNGNGVQEFGHGGVEPGIPGVTVTLTGITAAGGSITETTTTSGHGSYQFSEPPGTYTVSVTTPAGYVPTVTGRGTPYTDSNPSPSGTTPGTLLDGTRDPSIDFGFYQPVTIGDFVWNDLNGNGIQDSGEPGIPGGTLTLTGTDGAGNPVTATTTTDADGHYSFTEPPGTYIVSVPTPSGYVPTVSGQGTPATDGNPSPSGTTPGTLTSSGGDNTVDFGFYQPVTIGDFVWNDLNGNGKQDGGEPGIPGVTLNLTGTDGANSVTDTTTTDADGHYSFTEPPGTYIVSVTTPSGYVPTIVGLGLTSASANRDSNPNPSGTRPGTLPRGSSDGSIDFGFYQPVTIGDFVWNDANENGIQDAGEPGINGVVLALTGTTGAGAAVSLTTTTSGNGGYLFANLAPGTYTVTVDASNFSGSGVLVGYTAGPTLVGSNRAVDGNPSPSGTTPGALPSGSGDLTVDFGYFQTPSISGVVFADGKNGSTPLDGVRQAGESGIPGVAMLLLNSSGTIIATATTDANGNYRFSGLNAGTYTVVEGVPGAVNGVSYIHVTEAPGGTGGTIGDRSITTTLAASTSSTGNNFTEFLPYDGNTGEGAIAGNFNGTSIAFTPAGAGSYIWFSSVLKVSGLNSTTPTTMLFVNQYIDFTDPGPDKKPGTADDVSYHLPVPDSRITFSPAVTAATATTTFDTATNQWNITVPVTTSGNYFLSGLSFKVPSAGPPGLLNQVTWKGNLIADSPGTRVNWQWASAVYTTLGSDYNAFGVKPLDSATGQYNNSDHAGTPENYRSYVIGGARGGGVNSYTGSYSATGTITPTDPPIGGVDRLSIPVSKLVKPRAAASKPVTVIAQEGRSASSSNSVNAGVVDMILGNSQATDSLLEYRYGKSIRRGLRARLGLGHS